MQDGTIVINQIKASSYGDNWYPDLARLNDNSCWYKGPNDTKPWIQVDFKADVNIAGIQTQGDRNWITYVSHLQIQAGDSEESLSYVMEGQKIAVSHLLPCVYNYKMKVIGSEFL